VCVCASERERETWFKGKRENIEQISKGDIPIHFLLYKKTFFTSSCRERRRKRGEGWRKREKREIQKRKIKHRIIKRNKKVGGWKGDLKND